MSALEGPGRPGRQRLAAAMVAAAGRSTHNLGCRRRLHVLRAVRRPRRHRHRGDARQTLAAAGSRLALRPRAAARVAALRPRAGSAARHPAATRRACRRRVRLAREDLPRDDGGRALIGDTRNDENLIISQLHLLFIRFHNRVVDQIAAPGMPVIRVFHEARRLVRWHYQWLIVNDFLPKLVGEEAVAAARASGRRGDDGRARVRRARHTGSATAWCARTTSSTTVPPCRSSARAGDAGPGADAGRQPAAAGGAGDRLGALLPHRCALAAAQHADRRLAHDASSTRCPAMPETVARAAGPAAGHRGRACRRARR